MAKQSAPAKLEKLTKKKMNMIWEAIPSEDWLRICNLNHPDSRWELMGENKIRGLCPYHIGDTSPSFYIDLQKRFAKCFGSQCGKFESNPLALYAKLSRQNIVTATADLQKNYGITILSTLDSKELQKQYFANQVCEAFFEICANELERAWSNPNNPEVDYVKPLVTYLKDFRQINWKKEVVAFGVYPPERVIAKYIQDSELALGVSDFMKLTPDITNIGQLVSLYRYAIGAVAFFKVRRVRDLDGNLTENISRQKDIVTMQHPDIKGFTEEPAFFGLDFYKEELGKNTTVHLVEGEFDFASVAQNQYDNDLPRDIFLAIGGASSGFDFNCLYRDFGFKNVNLIMDAPEAKGEDLAYKIISNNEGMIAPYVFKWGNILNGKDPDNAVHINSNFREVYSKLTNYRNYYNEEEFLMKRMHQAIEKESSTMPLSTSQKLRLVVGELSNLKDKVLVYSIIPMICKELNVPPAGIMDMMPRLIDNELYFIEKLNNLFNKTYQVIGTIQNNTSTDSELLLWSKIKKRELRVSYSREKTAHTLMATEIGKLHTWISSSIGIPQALKFCGKNQDEPRIQPDIEKDLEKYLGLTLKESMKDKPKLYEDNFKKGGTFYLPRPKDKKTYDWYFHNGEHLFLGEVYDGQVKWQRSDTPFVNGYFFKIESGQDVEEDKQGCKQWARFATSEEEMNKDRLSLKDMWDKTHKIIGNCFNYLHEVDTFTAALMCFYTPIYPMFGRNIFLNVAGETSSGKSRYSLGIFSGTVNEAFKDWHLVEAISPYPNYTEAGLRQDLNSKNFLCVLDEFEDKGNGDHRSTVVKMILETFRGGEASITTTKGTPHGESRKFVLNAPLITLAIRPITEAADVNRFINISTFKKQGFQDAAVIIKKLMTYAEIEELRNSFTMGLFKYVGVIAKYYQDLQDELNSGKEVYKGIPFRTLSQLYPLAALYAAIYGDLNKGIEYIKMYAEQRKEELAVIANVGHTPLLWTELMRSEAFKLGKSGDEDTLQIDYTIHNILQNEYLRNQFIDQSIHGIKLHVTQEADVSKRKYYMIVSWNEAKAIFRSTSEFRTYGVSKLKTVAERDPDVLKEHQIRSIPNWKFITKENTALSEVTFKDVTSIVMSGCQGKETLEQEINKIAPANIDEIKTI